MQYIYARISRDNSSLENQIVPLQKQFPDAKVISETVSGYYEKPELEKLLAALRAGDTLIVWSLDRLGRRTSKALALLEDLSKRGVALVTIREGLDMTTAVGKFVATCMLGLAEMERNLISERIRTAMAVKKAEAKRTSNGWRCGRPNTYSPGVAARIVALRASGLTMSQIAAQTAIRN